MISAESKKVWLLAICYWIVVSLLCCLLYPVTISDTCARYAPMADYFARGEWEFAFHPRFGVIFQVLSGSVVKCLGVSGDCATQIVSIGFYAFATVPLWFVVRALFDSRTAWWTIALVLVFEDMTRYAFDGLRDSGKFLGFALLALGAVRRESKWYALGLFLLVTLASYCFAVSAVLLLGWCLFAPRGESAISRIKTMVMPVGAFLLASAIVIVMTHSFTGHWLPSPHYIRILGRWL